MNFVIKTLTLYKDLWYCINEQENSIKTEYLWKYRCGIKNNDTNPKQELFLLEGKNMGFAVKTSPTHVNNDYVSIAEGTYLFLQGLLADTHADSHALFLKASEELYLESLWQEKIIKNDIVFLRILEEDGKTVFQIFREIEKA